MMPSFTKQRYGGRTTSWLVLFIVAVPCVFQFCDAARTRIGKRLEELGDLPHASDDDNPCGGLTPAGRELSYTPDGIVANCEACVAQEGGDKGGLMGGKTGCKWCPLNMRCQPNGDACAHRGNEIYKEEDEKIKDAGKCEVAKIQTPWLRFMVNTYHYTPGQVINHVHPHVDAFRCLQWSLDWPVTDDPHMPYREPGTNGQKDKGVTEDNVGMWACMSTFLRQGLMAVLDGKFEGLESEKYVSACNWKGEHGLAPQRLLRRLPAIHRLWTNETDDTEDGELEELAEYEDFDDPGTAVNMSQSKESLPVGSLSSVAPPHLSRSGSTQTIDSSAPTLHRTVKWDVEAARPALCDFIILNPGAGTLCKVHAYGAAEFNELYKAYAQPNGVGDNVASEIRDELASGPLVSFDPGAGKSGSGFSRTWNDKYKVKLGLRRGSFDDYMVNEPQKLLHMVRGMVGYPGFNHQSIALKDHLEHNPRSLLNRYYGLVKLDMFKEGTFCLLMQDATYNLMRKAKEWMTKGLDGKPAFVNAVKAYDLKGPSRDQDKHSGRSTGYNADFRDDEGVIDVTKDQCKLVRRALHKDSTYLKAHRLIDYSIFMIAVELNDLQPPVSLCDGSVDEPFCVQEGTRAYTFSVIDFLNDKNFFKSHEFKNMLNPLEGRKFYHYGQGIRHYFAGICKSYERGSTSGTFSESNMERFASPASSFMPSAFPDSSLTSPNMDHSALGIELVNRTDQRCCCFNEKKKVMERLPEWVRLGMCLPDKEDQPPVYGMWSVKRWDLASWENNIMPEPERCLEGHTLHKVDQTRGRCLSYHDETSKTLAMDGDPLFNAADYSFDHMVPSLTRSRGFSVMGSSYVCPASAGMHNRECDCTWAEESC